MRYVACIFIGVLAGWIAGPLIFPQSNPLPSESKKQDHASLVLAQTGTPNALSLPTIEPIALDQAAAYWKNPPLAGTQEETEFRLGMLCLAESTADFQAIAQFVNATPNPDEVKDYAKIVFAALTERDPLATIEAAESLTNESIRNSLMRTVIEKWAEDSPDNALAFINNLPGDVLKEGRLVDAVIKGMANRDPGGTIERLADLPIAEDHHYGMAVDSWVSQNHEAAFTWLQALGDEPLKHRLMDQAIRSMAYRSPDTALEVTLSLPHDGERQHPAQTMLQELAAMSIPSALEKAVQGIHTLPEELRTEEFMRRFGRNAAINSPDKAIELSDKIPDNALLDQGYWEGLLSQVAWKAPARAAGLASRLEEGQGLSNVYESIMRSWMKSDEFSAAQWLAELAPSDSKDRAIRTFTNELFSMDPERAVQWASAIDNPERKAKQVHKLVEQWENIDASSARAWQAKQEEPSG